jgi:hypothetical protein
MAILAKKIPETAVGDNCSSARLLKPERELPHVSLHMSDDNNGTLFVNGVRASTGPISEATAVIRKIGYRAGDQFEMIHPNGSQVMVRLRTPEEREAGVSAIVAILDRPRPWRQ